MPANRLIAGMARSYRFLTGYCQMRATRGMCLIVKMYKKRFA